MIGLIPALAEALIEAGLVAADRRKTAEAVMVARMRSSPPDIAPDYRRARADLDELERRDTSPAPPPEDT